MRTDCISKMNVIFDDYGNAHSILFHRRNAGVDETIGYGDAAGHTAAADFGDGCLNGY